MTTQEIETLLSDQSELKWIPCYPSELPTDKVLWVTCDNGWYRYVDKVFWDMTEWSRNVSDVVAYMPYKEPEPYIGVSDCIMYDEDNLEKRLFGRADNIIPLEDMKKIMKESLDNAKTYGDFLNGMIIGAYKLGIEHGKVSCQETNDPLEKELPKKVVILREDNIINFCCPTCGNTPLEGKSRCSKCGQVIDWNAEI